MCLCTRESERDSGWKSDQSLGRTRCQLCTDEMKLDVVWK